MLAITESPSFIRHIIQELQKENTAVSGKNKLLESENKILMTETESLREVSSFLLGHTLNVLMAWIKDLRVLEENIEQSLEREEQALNAHPVDGASAESQRAVRELKVRSSLSITRTTLLILVLVGRDRATTEEDLRVRGNKTARSAWGKSFSVARSSWLMLSPIARKRTCTIGKYDRSEGPYIDSYLAGGWG